MLARKTVISTLAVLFIVCCGIQVVQQHQGWPGWSEKQQQHGRGTKAAPWSSQPKSPSNRLSSSLLQRALGSAARMLLSNNTLQQRPSNTTTAPAANGPARNGDPDTRTLPIDSADLQPQLNPAVLNATRPPPAPAPAPTSAAAGEANQDPYTGPILKTVSQVKAGDSCVCWTSDWCTCGWQSCPYRPPDRAAPLPSEAAQRLFGPDVLPQLHLSGDVRDGRAAPPLSTSMLRRFNKRISTQLINPLYQFTTQHYILEGAREVVAAGGDSFKFNLANLDARGNSISNVRTPLDMVRSPSLPYADVFDLPLSMLFFWVFPNYSEPYKDTYELAVYLLQRYQGTGKQFFIGMWEGDHALRKPGNLGHHVPPDPGRMETIQFVVQEKQRAIDNAKRDHGSCQNVQVWNYIEANFVLESIWSRSKISIVNWLLPTIDAPPVDYVSYSAYEVLFSGDWRLVNLTAAFDYMNQRLPDKPGVPGPRIFLGEWAYPLHDTQGKPGWDLEQSREKGLYAAAVAIGWGSQFNQYWQLYSNHRFSNGTGDRGFWLIKPNRRDTPIWTSMKDYFAASDIFLSRFWACYGGWPSDYTYRVWAVKTLMKLVNNDTKPEPVVRDLSNGVSERQAQVAADNTFGEFGPTITFTVSGNAPADAAARGSSYTPVSRRQSTAPLVPQFLPSSGDRGNCPLPQPMLPAGVPRPPPAPAPANATTVNSTNSTGSDSMGGSGSTAARPGNSSMGGSGSSTARPDTSATGSASAVNGTGGATQPALLTGFNSSSRVQNERGESAAAAGKQCGSWSNAKDRLTLNSQECPLDYPRISVDDVASGKAKPWTFGGIDRIGCANCQQKGLWPKFCLWRRTEIPLWDSISCNQRESTGRTSVQRNLDLAVEMTRHWPASTGISVPSGMQRVPPGPVEITPCDVFRLIRGRTLWIIGDSQMKGMFIALKCFMLEFWDLKQYAPTWNTTTLDYLDKLPRNAEAKCIHLPENTRICQLKVLWADTFAEKPAQGETRWSVPVWSVLQQHLAAPDDIFVLNFGLWYDSKNPTRYYNNLQSLGQAYQDARGQFPNWFFVETVKLHGSDPPGDQDAPKTVQAAGGGAETCQPTEDVSFDVKTSQLKKAAKREAAAIATAASQLLDLGVVPVYQMLLETPDSSSSSSSNIGGSGSSSGSIGSSSGKHRRRKLLGFLQPQGSGSAVNGVLLSWTRVARRLLQASLGHSLSQQQQQQQQAAASTVASNSSSSGDGSAAAAAAASRIGGGPLEDSPTFTRTQPSSGSNSSGQQQQQQSLPQPSVKLGSNSRNSSAAGPSIAQSTSQFPVLQPTFAANWTAGATNSSNGSASSSSSSSQSSQMPASPAPTDSSNAPKAQDPTATGRGGSPAASTVQPSPTPAAAAAAGAVALSAKPSPSPSPTPSPPAGPAWAAAGAAGAGAGPSLAAGPILAPGFGSVTLPPELATEAVLSGLWRNQIARALLRDRFGMAWVPVYNATVPVYWGHRNSPEVPDCIHYCNPGAPQNWLAQLMLAVAVNTKPLSGEVADRRCLWGTAVVYDEGEKGAQ